ncbi:probable cytochrome P450 6a14 [Lutzomyia longipalpis]|uniref:probable cytochrome P450 6a14 n=1 Tax=Lutzomyia longipalpis TaxID=7200 RepID=UPI002483393E|nr:probable cytochrome P450 6a14 [Lutzomyia longipalpis]XP_055684914.1 probable cytochrome P450 6a14 [Lutzomyia longipalpis]XP_055684915.1 probable cytochrome P450 6a14 [Lutzomyia longipalpis]XP_055684916.1 probable cytochrome P450 6a14 [Lutzomyia longipalpis]XP_055684917.1 probable cytochrome P450 6a14 [Lutzomyia longipalpis]XP_055684919.1 probable cytochrome P450 6a14 [Lutzomyia longipalpis]
MLLWSDVVFFLGAIVALVYFFFKRKFTFWAEHGVPYAEPSIPYGNIGDVGKKLHTTELFRKFYRDFKGKTPVMGFYAMTAPQAMLMDLDLIQRIFIKDFQYFHDRAQYYNIEDDPVSAHLFNIDGERWRTLRAKISPTFTSGKMKMMLPTVVDVANNFHRTLFKEIGREAEVEIKDYLSRFSTDVIGSCAFGLDCNSLENPNTEFRKYGDKAFSTPWWKVIKFNFASSFMSLARKLHITLIDKDVSNFYRGVVYETVKYREETGVQRNDFLNLLMQIRDKKAQDNDNESEEGKLTMNEIAAQCVVFFLAGFETSSTATTFAMYEMAKHPDIQEKARKNVMETLAKYGGKFTYEATMEMTYLDQVINETMRKYPPLGSLTRRVTQDYQVPGTKCVLKKDIRVIIPVHAIQNDPEIFPDPDKFDPERFSAENVKNRHSAAFLPFGDGPRNCIGLRFGMLQMRIGLATILKSFRVTTSARTPNPLIIRKDTFAMTSKGGMWLKLKRISE